MPVFFGDKDHINFGCALNLKDEEPKFDCFFFFAGQLILRPIEPD